MQTHAGSCHCGRIAFTVEGEVKDVIDCNCSMCRRKGALLAAFPRAALQLKTPEADLQTYRFNQHVIDHHFCPAWAVAPFREGKGPDGQAMTMINVRCLPDVDLASLNVIPYDGASR